MMLNAIRDARNSPGIFYSIRKQFRFPVLRITFLVLTSKKITFHLIFWHETSNFSGDFPALLFGDFYKLWPQIDPHHLNFSLVWSFDWVFPPTPYWIYNKREWQVRRVVTGKFVADGSFVGSNYPQKIENELCFVASKPSKASSLSMHWNPVLKLLNL